MEHTLLKIMPAPARLQRVFYEHPIYYVTICTHGRRPILTNSIVHDAFVQFGLRALNRRIQVGRYVIMPDHLHLFVSFGPDSMSLSAWVKSLKNAISKALKPAKTASPHWQKGFFDHVLRSAESYEQKWLYVRNNPVRAGLIESADDWPYGGEISALLFDGDCGRS